MLEIVTLQETKLWIRVDHDHEDATIQTLIDAATETVLAIADGYDPAGDAPPPATLCLAILAHVARAFDNRDAVDAPEGNARLLSRLRTLGV